ncbi:MAG TPA: signal peptidase I [Chloroflexota bacterium]|nr:signal peptidase I [Chloroflexota bacterium]
MTELRGRVQQFGLASVMRLGTELDRSGCLTISEAGMVGQVLFAPGRVVAASVGEERGQPALEFIALALAEGDFVYSDRVSPSIEPNLELTAHELQVELEELLARPKRQGSGPVLGAVPHVAQFQRESSDRQVVLNGSELATLLAVDGRRTTHEIVSSRDPVQALHTLTRLVEAGVIELDPPAAPVMAEPAIPIVPEPAIPVAAESAIPVVPVPAAPPPVKTPRRPSKIVRDVVQLAILTVLFVIALRGIVHSVHVQGQSMLPGLHDGQLLLVNRLAYLFGHPARGDVVVFQSPDASDSEFVKRVTGLPHENIRIAHGSVFVDGRLLDEPYTAPTSGIIDTQLADELSIRVPDDSYFVLGDNRSVSLDSRLGWFVRADQLIGQAWLSYWPLETWGLIAQPRVAEIPSGAPGVVQPPKLVADSTPEVVQPGLSVVGSTPETVAATATTVVVTPTTQPTVPAIRTLLSGSVKDQVGWPSDPNGTAWLDGDSYRLTARQPRRFVAVSAPLGGAYTDIFVSAAFHKIGGPPGGGYGIIVRDEASAPRTGMDQDGRFYVAEVGDRGEVGLWRREDDHWVEMLPWTRAEAVRPGGSINELTLRAVGQRLNFEVNGTEVATVVDAALQSGRVGAFVGGEFNDVVLDRFAVDQPPGAVQP